MMNAPGYPLTTLRCVLLVFPLVLAAASPAREAEATATQTTWVQVAAHSPGLHGSHWRTDLGLRNVGTAPAAVQVRFHPPDGGPPITADTQVAPGAQSVLEDVVGQLGFVGTGALETVSTGPVLVTSRTYNVIADDAGCNPGGTFGQYYAGYASGEGLAAGESAWLAHLAENPRFRSNLAFTNTGDAPAAITVELFDGAGASLGSFTVSLNPGQYRQETQVFLNRAGQNNLQRGSARLLVTSGSGVIASASVVDNTTNDPTTIPMLKPPDPGPPPPISTVAINEFMASNQTTIADEDGDFPDWIELANFGEEPVNLTGFGFSDRDDEPFRWIFPRVTLAPGEYLLIWASGKDRRPDLDDNGTPPSGVPGLHTNFAISADGEELLLTAPGGTRVDYVPPTPVPPDISYGRYPNGTGAWTYFQLPTPGEANTPDGMTDILAPPVFSQPGGFLTAPFSLSLAAPDPDAHVLYTLDGSEPDPTNLEGRSYLYKNHYPQYPESPMGEFLTGHFRTHSYTEPIPISDRSGEPNTVAGISTTFHETPVSIPADPLFKGTVVRARAFKLGVRASETVTHTYFVTPDQRSRYSLPILSLALQEDAAFEYSTGIYVAGSIFDQWRLSNPNMQAPLNSPANYTQRGGEWERRGHLEFFEPGEDTAVFHQDMGIRIHGGWSRAHPMKSLRLYARGEYGAPTFSHRLFPELPFDEYKRFILRNSGNDFTCTLLRDAAIQKSMAHLNLDTQAYRPGILFLNGEYWGIHNLRERYDRHYMERVYGIGPNELDFLFGDGAVDEGDNSDYRELIDYLHEHDIAQDEHFRHIERKMDLENFVDYQIANIFSGNTDWPANNVEFWRKRTDSFVENASVGHDGRWRWLAIDMDFGFGLYGALPDHDTLSFATDPAGPDYPNPPWSTFLLRTLLTNDTFRIRFVNRFADLLNTSLRKQYIEPLILSARDGIAAEMPEHVDRWNQPRSIAFWEQCIDDMLDFVAARPEFQRSHLKTHFNLGEEARWILDVSDPGHGFVRINTVAIHPDTPGVGPAPYPWTGRYHQGLPVQLEGVPLPGHAFSHWVDLPPSTPALVEQTSSQPTHQATAVFTTATPIHFWHFNDLSGDTHPSVAADHSLTDIPAVLTYPGSGDGFMDSVNDGTPLNALPGTAAGRALRVRNPSDPRELLLSIPTTGFGSITLSYAVRRTPNGAREQILFYRTESDGPWRRLSGARIVTEDYQTYAFALHDTAAHDNPDLQVRILFRSPQASNDSGNNRFDNIRVEGLPIP